VIFAKDSKELYHENVDNGTKLDLVHAPEAQSGEMADSLKPPLIRLVGEKKPVVIVECLGADSSFSYLVYAFSDVVTKIGAVKNGFDHIRLEPADGGAFELGANDSFPDWGADGVAVDVILKWNGSRFELDQDRMKHSAPTREEYEHRKNNVREEFERIANNEKLAIAMAPPELAEYIVKLYYCGHGDLARKQFNDMWPSGRPGREKFWALIMDELKKSPYWADVESLNDKARKH
jgi:hypothetical protein